MYKVLVGSSSGSVTSAQLREAMARRLHRRAVATGKMSLPAVPGMLESYVSMCLTAFSALGTTFSAEQTAHLRAALQDRLTEAFLASQRSNIVITYSAPVGTTLNYWINTEVWTVEGAYENWIATREPPLFGTEPDARVWALSNEALTPRNFRILDIGAGTGRNALALARRGHPVDVVEMTPKFAAMIREGAARELLNVRVIQRDVFTTLADLRQDYDLILLSEVVSDFRTTQQLRAVFEVAAHCLSPGGRLVFNTFLAREGYLPDSAAREIGQQMYTSIFTRPEMDSAAAGLPLVIAGDDSVYEYEQAHLPHGAWPPTSWYVDWVTGLDVFDVPREESPIAMRWLVYQKSA